MIILDTHSWIWYVTESSKLSMKAVYAIKEAEICGVSAISCWEIAMLVEQGRIALTLPIEKWIKLALNYEKIDLVPLTPEISIKSVKKDLINHNDPADRIIAATSIITNSPLITKDEKLRINLLLNTIW